MRTFSRFFLFAVAFILALSGLVHSGEYVVVCYGDSNTWGFVPGTGQRYPFTQRWPGVMAGILGPNYRIVEEGLNGRTTIFGAPREGLPDRNGETVIRTVLATHAPIDLVIIMLGTNDLPLLGATPDGIADNVGKLVDITRSVSCGPGLVSPPKVLVICPPPVVLFDPLDRISQILPSAFAKMGELLRVAVVIAGDVVQPSPVDGVHFSPEGHAALGKLVAEHVKKVVDGNVQK